MSLKPFAGIKVVELGTFVATPACAMLMAEWGADVVKVESGKGDNWRSYANIVSLPCTNDENPLFDMFNHGKKAISLDLKNPDARAVFDKLLSEADVFITSWREKALKKQGLDYDSLKGKYPKLIYAILTGYGDEGPNKDEPGYDNIAFWAKTGFLADQGIVTPGSYPILPPGGMGDLISGITLFGAVAAALYGRSVHGKGDRVSVSLYGTGIFTMGLMTTVTQERFKGPYPRPRYNCTAAYAPFECSDGEWIQLSVANWDAVSASLFDLLGLPELKNDERFLTNKQATKNRKELLEYMEPAFRTKTGAEWVELLTEADVAHDRLNHYRDTEKSEQAWANGYVTTHTTQNGNRCMVARPPLRSRNVGDVEFGCGPRLGENTAEILKALGYSDEQVADLLASGAAAQFEA